MKKIILEPGEKCQILESSEEMLINPKNKKVKIKLKEHQVREKVFSNGMVPEQFKTGRTFLGYHWGFICSKCNALHLIMQDCPSCGNNTAHFAKSKGGGFSAYCDNCDSNIINRSWECSKCNSSNPVNPIYEIDGIPDPE